MITQASKKLIRWREKRGLSQTALAKELSVAQPTVSDWEAGRKTPRTKHVLAITAVTKGAVPMKDWIVPAESAHA